MRERLGPLAPEISEIYKTKNEFLERDFRLITTINRAHAVMLGKQNILNHNTIAELLKVISELESEGGESLYKDPGPEDLYSTVEQALIKRVGPDIGGRLHTGRSRNDLAATVSRMATRERFISLTTLLLDLRKLLIAFSSNHIDTIMTGYTHLQPAQPTTLGHYLISVSQAIERDSNRLLQAYPRLNLSPLGACAFAGTGFPIDRGLTAKLLGFTGIVESTTDAVASRDYAIEILAGVASLGVTLSRLAQDLYLWCSDEWTTIEIANEAAISSSIMPQKKNPVTLEIIKAKAAHLIGALTSSLTVQKGLNFMHCHDMSHESVDPIWDALTHAEIMIKLAIFTISGLKINKGTMLNRTVENFSTVTELADLLVREKNLPFRTAHSIVGNVVSNAISQGIHADGITIDLVYESAVEVSGVPVLLTEDQLASALDPIQNLENKKASGSPSKRETQRLIEITGASIEQHQEKIQNFKNEQNQASTELDHAVAAIRFVP